MNVIALKIRVRQKEKKCNHTFMNLLKPLLLNLTLMVMFYLLILLKRGVSFLVFFYYRCTYHLYPHKDWFSTYYPVDFVVIHMGNNAQCIVGISTIEIKTHYGVVNPLSNVHCIPDLQHNLISLSILESKVCKNSTEGKVFEDSQGCSDIV